MTRLRSALPTRSPPARMRRPKSVVAGRAASRQASPRICSFSAITRSDAEHESPVVQHGTGGCRLSDHRWVHPYGRAGHCRRHRQRGRLRERADHRRSPTTRTGPRPARRSTGGSGLRSTTHRTSVVCPPGPLDERLQPVLLRRQEVADPHARHLAAGLTGPPSGSPAIAANPRAGRVVALAFGLL